MSVEKEPCKCCVIGEQFDLGNGFFMDGDNDLVYYEDSNYNQVNEYITIKYCPKCGRDLG